jgi:hypothetical protein
MQLSIVDDERNEVHSGAATHDKRGAGGTAEGKGACFLGWQRAGTTLAANAAKNGSGRCQPKFTDEYRKVFISSCLL